MGQIALHGIVRAPARVRAVAWLLPDHQLRKPDQSTSSEIYSQNSGDGDPSQDVAHASVLFLVDAKLVLLQPSTNEEGELKYDMRVIASNVEYFDLTRDQVSLLGTPEQSPPSSPLEGQIEEYHEMRGLKDSLWYFDGDQVRCWTDVEGLLHSISDEYQREPPTPISISTDFYPSSVLLDRGIVLGMEADLVQRRDVRFAFFRLSIKVSQSSIPHAFPKLIAARRNFSYLKSSVTTLHRLTQQ